MSGCGAVQITTRPLECPRWPEVSKHAQGFIKEMLRRAGNSSSYISMICCYTPPQKHTYRRLCTTGSCLQAPLHHRIMPPGASAPPDHASRRLCTTGSCLQAPLHHRILALFAVHGSARCLCHLATLGVTVFVSVAGP
eukprot:1191640-Prorocentrum_minimum.AAC.1